MGFSKWQSLFRDCEVKYLPKAAKYFKRPIEIRAQLRHSEVLLSSIDFFWEGS